MRHALLHRAGQSLLVLWAAFTLSFLLQVLPGDAVLIKFQNPDQGLSPQQIAEMRQAYGADSPIWQQYLHTLLAMLRGDFGYSVQAGAGQRSAAQHLPRCSWRWPDLPLPAWWPSHWRWRDCLRCACCVRYCSRCRHCLFRCRRSGLASR